MPFRPMNSDHSIEAMGFSLTLDRSFSTREIQTIHAGHDLWWNELPASQYDEKPRPGMVHFAFLLPDGSASWELTATGNTLSVVCRQYTRWSDVWSQTLKFFAAVHGQLAEVKNELSPFGVTELALEAVDRFVDKNSQSYDLKELFKPDNPRLLQSMFDAGPNWHQHTGSFSKWSSEFERLEQINFGSNQLSGSDEDAETEQFYFVRLKHVQRLRPKGSIDIKLASILASDGQQFSSEMKKLHDANKALLRETLTEKMQKEIRLDLGEA